MDPNPPSKRSLELYCLRAIPARSEEERPIKGKVRRKPCESRSKRVPLPFLWDGEEYRDPWSVSATSVSYHVSRSPELSIAVPERQGDRRQGDRWVTVIPVMVQARLGLFCMSLLVSFLVVESPRRVAHSWHSCGCFPGHRGERMLARTAARTFRVLGWIESKQREDGSVHDKAWEAAWEVDLCGLPYSSRTAVVSSGKSCGKISDKRR